MARKQIQKDETFLSTDKPFYENDLIGSAIETRLWRILADSGYNVIHFFKEQVDEHQNLNRRWDGNATVERLHSAPELYVTIAEPQLVKRETRFVETKFRNAESAENVVLEESEQLTRQLDYWHDVLLVIFIPKKAFWYGQELAKLEKKIRDAAQKQIPVSLNLLTEFRPITEFFSQVKPEKLSGWTKPLLRLIDCLRPSNEEEAISAGMSSSSHGIGSPKR